MRKTIVSVIILFLFCSGAALAQGRSATTPTLKVSDGQKSFNGVNELRVPPGCVTFSGRMAVINCTAGASSGTATSQNGNLFYASPDGSYGLPSWRAVVEADLPGLSAAKTSSGIFATARLGSGTASSSTYLRGDQTWAALPAAVTSVFGRAGAVVAASGDYTWAQIDKTTSSLADLATRSAGDLTTGTLGVLRGGTGVGTAFTQGSVIFAGASGVYSQSNSKFFWDSATERLGVGTSGPTQTLHVVGRGLFQNTGSSSAFLVDRTDGKIGAMGAAGSSVTLAYDSTGIFKIESNARATIAAGTFGTGATTRLHIDASGNVGIGTASAGTSAANVLSLANATAPTTSPAGIGQVYVESGALKYRGTSGSAATLANANGTRTTGTNGTAVALERLGTCTLNAGVCVVSDANVTSASKIFLTAQDDFTSGALRISARTEASSFTITSSNGDDSGVVAWRLIN
jgi:hypothetical protein